MECLLTSTQSEFVGKCDIVFAVKQKQDLLIISIFATKLSFLLCLLFKETALILLFSIWDQFKLLVIPINQYLHFTSTTARLVAGVPYPLSAVHLYDPTSSLFTLTRDSL